jgi:hypothetical protein
MFCRPLCHVYLAAVDDFAYDDFTGAPLTSPCRKDPLSRGGAALLDGTHARPLRQACASRDLCYVLARGDVCPYLAHAQRPLARAASPRACSVLSRVQRYAETPDREIPSALRWHSPLASASRYRE